MRILKNNVLPETKLRRAERSEAQSEVIAIDLSVRRPSVSTITFEFSNEPIFFGSAFGCLTLKVRGSLFDLGGQKVKVMRSKIKNVYFFVLRV